MRIYDNFLDMLSEVKRDVAELGIRGTSESFQNQEGVGREYDMKEILGYSYELTDTTVILGSFSIEEANWLGEEFGERITNTPINPGNAWKLRKEVWEPFLNDKNKFDYTYNERIRPQLSIVIDELRRNPHTRQAIITIYRNQDLNFLGGKRRIPCSLSYQFLLRGNYLNMVYNMRSCDVSTHFKFDVALACMLINHVAIRLQIDPGSLIHNIGSLHIFRKDAKNIF